MWQSGKRSDILKLFNIGGIAHILLAPIGMLLVGLITRLYRKIKLIDYKQEALVHAFSTKQEMVLVSSIIKSWRSW